MAASSLVNRTYEEANITEDCLPLRRLHGEGMEIRGEGKGAEGAKGAKGAIRQGAVARNPVAGTPVDRAVMKS